MFKQFSATKSEMCPTSHGPAPPQGLLLRPRAIPALSHTLHENVRVSPMSHLVSLRWGQAPLCFQHRAPYLFPAVGPYFLFSTGLKPQGLATITRMRQSLERSCGAAVGKKTRGKHNKNLGATKTTTWINSWNQQLSQTADPRRSQSSPRTAKRTFSIWYLWYLGYLGY